ncbi:(2Fe-2S) ferredoxin domain-containing protein [bacterium]|nr:(2Fe-2S) ferredoxin domain-containing protein [bacterium]
MVVVQVEICMGSSCFARGNGEHVKMLKKYISEHQVQIKLSLKGSLCNSQCSNGPVITINGKLYTHIDSSTLIDLLDHHSGSASHE